MEIVIGIVCLVFGWLIKGKYDALLKQPTREEETEQEQRQRENEEKQWGNLFSYNEHTAMKGGK